MDELSAEDFLRLVAGELCPCGHIATQHEGPPGDFAGEVFGPCQECACGGLIDFKEGDFD